MIILAILFPPLYFLLNKRMGMCVLTGAMFIAAIFLAMTVVLLPGSLILWFIAFIAAIRHNRRKTVDAQMVQHAELIATKMAEKMPQSKSPSGVPLQILK